MAANDFKLNVQAVLDKVKSIANIKADIKAIEPKLPKIKIQGTLDSTSTRKELNSKLKYVKPKVKVDADTTQAEKKIKKIGKQKTNTTITPTVDTAQVVSGLKKAGKETKTLWERFTANIFGANLIRMGTQKIIQAVHGAMVAIKEFDTIKTNIQMVSGSTDSEVNAMMSSYNAMAKELSSTTKEVSTAANEFLRMGEGVADTNELIKNATILSKVGMIDSADATSYLISSMKGYQVSAEKSIDIVSKLTAVDLEAAVSAGGLAEAISRCSNIANNSGTSMDRLIGYAASIGEVTQESMSVVGNSIKSMYSRMNNIKIGRFIDDETGESLSDTEAVLNKLGIQLRDTQDTYRNFDDVLDDVGKNWKGFTQVEQNAISVAIAGTMQRERFTALMNNYSSALEYSEVAANSAGSALERYGVYQDSIEAKTNELTAALESLSTNIVSEELYSGIIQTTTGLVEFLDKTNLLKTSLAGLVAMGVSKAIVSIGTGFITAAKSTAQLTAAMALFENGLGAENLEAIGVACKGLSDQQLKLILSTKGLKHEDRALILAGMGVAETEQQQTLATLGFANAENAATVSTFSLKGAFIALKTAMATNPIGLIVTAVTTATMAFSWFKQKQEEAAQALQDAISEYDSAKSSLESVNSELEEQNKKLDELLSKDKLTYAEKGQLEELQAITKELLLQQDIEERRADKASKEAADKAVDAYKKQYGRYDNTEEDLHEKLSYENFPIPEGADDVLGMAAAYVRAKELLGQSQKDYDEALKNGEDTTWLADDLQYNIDAVNDYKQALDDSISDLQGKRAALENEYNKAVEKREIGIEPLTSSEKDAIETYESIYDVMRMVYEYTNQNAWNNMEIANIFNTEGIEKTKDELAAMYKAGELSSEEMLKSFPKLYNAVKESELIAGEGSDAFREFFNELAALAGKQEDTARDAAEASFTDIISQVQSLSDGLDRLGKIYTDVKNREDFDWSSILNNEEFARTFSGMGAAYGSFIETVGNAPDDIEACQNAFNKLATAYIYNTKDANGSNIMDNLTRSTKDATTAMLEQMGVANASEAVTAALAEKELELAANKQYLAKESKSLADATASEIAQFGAEQAEAGGCSEALALFCLKKALLNTVSITTASDCRNMLMLAEAANIGTQQLEQLETLMGLITQRDNAKESGDSRAVSELNRAVSEFKKNMVSGLDFGDIELDFSGAADSAAKAGRSSADAYLGAYKNELKELEHMCEMGLISGEDYWQARIDLNEKYFGESSSMHEKYLDEYRGNEEEILKGLKDLWEDYYDDRKNDLKDLISYAEKLYDKERDSLESSIGKLEERRDIEEKYWKSQIDAIGDEIDALEDANAERQRAIDLQNKQWALQKAMHQRTMLLYSENKGMHYVSDSKAVRSAKNDLDDAVHDNKAAGLKKQQEDLQKQLDIILETYDSQIESIKKQIDSLKEVKSAWSEIAENQELAELEERLKSIFGGDVKDKILSGNADFINSIISQYSSTSDMLRTIEDAALADIQGMAARYGVIPQNLMHIKGAVAEAVDTLGSVDMSGFNANLGSIAKASSDAAEKVRGAAKALNELSNEISSYQMPALNPGNFTGSFAEDGAILTALRGFTDRFREICGEISSIWNASLSGIGRLPGDAKYETLFSPLLAAVDNCKLNLDTKLNECLESFNVFQAGLSGVIGASGDSEGTGTEGRPGKSPGGGTQSGTGSGSDTIVGAVTEGGTLIGEVLNGGEESWTASFNTAKDSIHETAASIVECIESMAESITNACIAAIEAINMLEQAQGEPGSRPIPSQYGRSGHNHGENGNAYAYGSNGLPKAKKNALVSEYGQTEMTVLPNGNTIITDTPTLMDLPKDTVIYNEEETKKIMDNKVDAGGAANADRKTIVNSGSTITAPDGSVLTPTSQEDYIRKLQKKSQESIIPQAERPYCVLEQERLEKCAAALGKSIDEMMNPMNIIARNIKDMTGMGKYMENTNNVSSAADSRNIQQPVTVQIGDIHLTGVQDVNGLSQAIKTRLPGQMMQEYFKN